MGQGKPDWLLGYNTRLETLSRVREMFLFFCNIGKKTLLTLSFCFNEMFSLIYIKGITPTTSKMEILMTMVNGCQLLTNVRKNYILDVTGSHICYCHNNLWIKLWNNEWVRKPCFCKVVLLLLNYFSPDLLSFRNQFGEFQITLMDWFLHDSNTELKWVSYQ